MHKILIVEDDPVISAAISAHLEKWGYAVSCAENFEDILTEFLNAQPGLVLLDISLPFRNGYHWCSEIRRVSSVPIIFISSASDSMNIIMAMNMGADDFIPKPFDLTVLSAKVAALLRRAYSFGASMNIIERGGVILNLNDTTLIFSEHTLPLTKNDFKILQVLMESGGRIVSRETLMQRLWESESFIDDNTLTVNMTRLRKKLEGIGLCDFITTKKGLGYMVE